MEGSTQTNFSPNPNMTTQTILTTQSNMSQSTSSTQTTIPTDLKIATQNEERNVKIRDYSSLTKRISKIFLNRQKYRKKTEQLEPSFYLHANALMNNGDFLWDDGANWSKRIWKYKERMRIYEKKKLRKL